MNMNDPIATLLGSWAIELNIYSILLRVAISVVFAAIIGCERASKRHADVYPRFSGFNDGDDAG